MIKKIEDNSWFWKKEWGMTGGRYTETFKSISNVPVQQFSNFDLCQNHVGNLVKKQNKTKKPEFYPISRCLGLCVLY